jgi:hypothetical protein
MRRRGRGQHRKPGQHHHHHHHQGRNQTFDSNGPGVRLRGTAHQIYEKYLMLGRDSASSGDRIMSENYLQHADHYYRHILANQGPLEQFSERGDGQDGEIEAETNGYGQGEQPSPGEGQQPQAAYGNTVPQTQGLNGSGSSQGTSLPGANQPRNEGQREGRADDRRGDDRRGDDRGDNRGEGRGDGNQGGQGQHNNFRRDRFNRRFRNRDDRPYQGQGGGDGNDRGNERNDRGNERNDRGNEQRNDRGGERREGREQRDDRPHRGDRDHRPQRQEEEAFEPPAFLKAERPAGETPPRDPFNRDDEQR